jgi:hypothetical protein
MLLFAVFAVVYATCLLLRAANPGQSVSIVALSLAARVCDHGVRARFRGTRTTSILELARNQSFRNAVAMDAKRSNHPFEMMANSFPSKQKMEKTDRSISSAALQTTYK